MPLVPLDGSALDCRQVDAVARRGAQVIVTETGMARARAAHAAVEQIAETHPVYGRTTGVGANKTVTADATGHGLRLLRSHAVGAGPALPPEVARAMLVVRLNQLAAGGAGVAPELLDTLATVINEGRTPPLRRYGAIGTGDLTALAGTALCILGERPWLDGSTSAFRFDDADALAFISSSAATIGQAALACHDLGTLLDAAIAVATMSVVAAQASAEPFAAPVHAARPHPGQVAVAARIREHLGDGYVPGQRIQDAYSFRALPQVHGPALDAAAHLDRVLAVDLNAASENPLVEADRQRVWHNGNFHTAYLALALDGAAAALDRTASLSVARLSSLLATAGARPFLAAGPDGSSGLMILEYVAHAALADIRSSATAGSSAPVTLSAGVEDHASFATQAADRLTLSVQAYVTVLTCELVAAVRALRQSRAELPARLHGVWVRVVDALDSDMSDRSVEADLDAAADLLPTLTWHA